ncbi:hypothetical protein D3C84_1216150 [compost metagenome]
MSRVWRACASMPPLTTWPWRSMGICAVYSVPLPTTAHSMGAREAKRSVLMAYFIDGFLKQA